MIIIILIIIREGAWQAIVMCKSLKDQIRYHAVSCLMREGPFILHSKVGCTDCQCVGTSATLVVRLKLWLERCVAMSTLLWLSTGQPE